jgi:hypothetical protein
VYVAHLTLTSRRAILEGSQVMPHLVS